MNAEETRAFIEGKLSSLYASDDLRDLERIIEEDIVEIKNGGSVGHLLQHLHIMLSYKDFSVVAHAAKICIQQFPDSAVCYQVLKMLLESNVEELEAYALSFMHRLRPVSDLKYQLIYLRDRHSSDLISNLIGHVIEIYDKKPAFVKRPNGYLEFISIYDLVTFLEEAHTPGNWIYRGHSSEDWLLIPNMVRHLFSEPRSFGQEIQERLPPETLDFWVWLLNNDRVKQLTGGRHYNPIEALGIAQHFQFKTPLLDFSKNYRVAAFFASHPPKDCGCGVLYCISISEMHSLVGTAPSKEFAWITDAPYLIDQEFPGLHRIHNQEGVFLHSIPPAIMEDLAISRFYFRHNNTSYSDETINEKYIYPPSTPLEKEIEEYRNLYTGYSPYTFDD